MSLVPLAPFTAEQAEVTEKQKGSTDCEIPGDLIRKAGTQEDLRQFPFFPFS